MAKSDGRRVVVCLGYPDLLSEAHAERARAVDPAVEVVTLPVDRDGNWIGISPAEPHAEPPPWAQGQAAARLDALARAEVMLALHAPKDLPSLAPKLRWLHGVGAGIEQFARAGVRRDQVVVTNSSGLSAGSMAEYVIGRLLQVWKRFPEQAELQARREYKQTWGRTFAGSTLGIVGLGNIGRAVGERARALGVRVLGIRRSYRPGDTSPAADALFGLDALHAVLARCDAVVVAAPDTEENLHLIDAAALAAMPRGSMLVNVARGSLVDESAVIEALRAEHLGWAALDVFSEEPLPPESPLWGLPNALLSAHSSVSTDRYVADVFDLFLENLGHYVRGETMRNQVDMEALGFG